ncbi:phage tail protein [Rhodohalobacter sp. 8-1]|uniref:phage tail protein n=1 Tax=Rhodohalobacter sp. 8-1 TaxID=3131972 RepID=UPI0030EDBC81
MAQFHPPTGFHFLVRFEGLQNIYPGIPDVGFQEVSGINVDIGVEEYQEGGENRFAHRLPQPVSYPNLIMKRGILIDSQLVQWFRGAVEGFTFEANDISVVLLNNDHDPLQAWNFINAWPVKWSVDGLHAEENKIMIESIEFAYQYYRRINPVSIS